MQVYWPKNRINMSPPPCQYINWESVKFMKPLGVPQLFGFPGHAVTDFGFHALEFILFYFILEFIFKMQKNILLALAAHFPFIEDDS